MDKKIITNVVLILLTTAGNCWAGCCTRSPELLCEEKIKADPVDAILKQLNQKTRELKSYQCRIENLFRQPLAEDEYSETLRKGVLYYQKADKKSKLRLNLKTLKQDDEKEQKYIEHYIFNGDWLSKVDYKFEGVWLTHIDYQIKAVECHQLAEPNDPNAPADTFELVSRNFPIIGFSKTEDLKKEFEIKLVEEKGKKAKDFTHLHLKVKPDSVYKDDYTSMDFWIDKKLGLPAKIVALSIEGDIRQIKLLKPKVNKGIDKKIFQIKIPKGFAKPQITPLKKRSRQ